MPEQAAPPPQPPAAPRELEDLFKGELPLVPWQNQRYSADNKLWQAAAMRRRQHFRRSNVSLGVCTVDLSGPHEPTPRPGYKVGKNQAVFFLVLTVRPDRTAERADTAVQTDEGEPTEPEPRIEAPQRPLLYAALLIQKSATLGAIMKLLAQMRAV